MPRKKATEPDLNDVQKVDLKATRIFFENMMSDKEITIDIGGGGSSKSHSLIQLFTYKLLSEKNKKILIVRKTLPSLRTSVLLPFYDILDQFGVRERIKEDKVGMNLFYNDNMIHFNGLDNPEKIKSSSWNYMWFEEATDITEMDFNTVRLYLRAPSVDKKPNQIFMSFNPIDEFHWIKEKLIDNPEFSKNVKVIHSTYKDNPFLDDRSKERYEDLINQDINFYRIYALGEWGKLENLIYRNWDIVDTIPVDGKGLTLYGIDFGFNDPTVITKCIVKDKEVWLDEVLYQSNMTNSQLINYMQSNIPRPDWSKPIYADSAEPQRIKEIRLAGFNIKPAQKNVLDGIDMCKRLQFHVHRNSSNIIKEFRAYSWKTDKRGNIIDEPVDFLNHACVVPDTLITTINGPVEIQNIKVGDSVQTHTGKFRKVLNVLSREYKGEMFRLKPSCRFPLYITPNHPVYITEAKRFTKKEGNKKLTGQLRLTNEFKFINSEDIVLHTKKTERRIIVNTPIIKEEKDIYFDMQQYFPDWVEIDNEKITPRRVYKGKVYSSLITKAPRINKNIKLTNEIAFMLGYFVAEGSKNGCRGGDNRRSVNFAGHVKEKNVLDILNIAFEPFDVKTVYWEESKNDNGRRIRINNSPIYKIVEECGKEENKRFPNYSYLLDREKTIYLLSGYLFGDGCFVRKQGIYSNSISRYITMQVGDMIAKLGYRYRIREQERKEGKKQYIFDMPQEDSIKLFEEMMSYDDIKYVFKDKRIKEFKNSKLLVYQTFITDNYFSSILRKKESFNYTGTVYNLEVEKDNSYVANGVTVHNCDAIRYPIYSQFRGEGIYKMRWIGK